MLIAFKGYKEEVSNLKLWAGFLCVCVHVCADVCMQLYVFSYSMCGCRCMCTDVCVQVHVYARAYMSAGAGVQLCVCKYTHV